MKEIILNVFVTACVIYLVGSFICNDFNYFNWGFNRCISALLIFSISKSIVISKTKPHKSK